MDRAQKLSSPQAVPAQAALAPLTQLWPFFLPTLLYWALLAYELVRWGYRVSFIYLNHINFALGDGLFPNLTNLGDSLILASLLTLLFWHKDRALAIVNILSITVSGLLAQLLKKNFFESWDRPLKVFEDAQGLVHSFPHELLHHESFPSGHATTVFSGFLAVSYLYTQRKRGMQVLWAGLAILVSFSRIYIGVHFPADVLAGAVLGVACLLLLMRWLYLPLSHWFALRPLSAYRYWDRALQALGAILLVIGLLVRYSYLFIS